MMRNCSIICGIDFDVPLDCHISSLPVSCRVPSLRYGMHLSRNCHNDYDFTAGFDAKFGGVIRGKMNGVRSRRGNDVANRTVVPVGLRLRQESQV